MMIIEIQNRLKAILLQSSQLSEELIFTNPNSSNISSTWISILPSKALLSPAWHWDNQYYQSSGEHKFLVKIHRKYNVTQPIRIHFSYQDKNHLSKSVDDFLIQLPKEITINDGSVHLLPNELEYFFPKGELGTYTASLLINVTYSIRTDNTNTDIIKDIDLSVNYNNK